MTRHLWVIVHRYIGLTVTIFLVIVGLTGNAMPTRLADKITGLIQELHMARIFGLPMKIFVCVMGMVITMLSMTGAYIWLRKRRGQ